MTDLIPSSLLTLRELDKVFSRDAQGFVIVTEGDGNTRDATLIEVACWSHFPSLLQAAERVIELETPPSTADGWDKTLLANMLHREFFTQYRAMETRITNQRAELDRLLKKNADLEEALRQNERQRLALEAKLDTAVSEGAGYLLLSARLEVRVGKLEEVLREVLDSLAATDPERKNPRVGAAIRKARDLLRES